MGLARTPRRAEDHMVLLARVLLATLFLVFGWSKLMDVAGTSAYMQQLGVPASQFAAVAAVVIELGGGALIVVGLWTRSAACLLAIYTIAAGLIGHPFWLTEGEQRYIDTVNFYKNLCIAGGCLLLLVTGSGRFAVDAKRSSD
ncbi:DoxX family protein [Pseudoxanthomonas sp. PXM01]|nr:DoxX family protein [Pseudoxanthomonas sp. PXM01]